LEKLKENFSEKAHADFIDSLTSEGQLQKIEKEKLVLNCELTGAPVIVETKRGEKASWRLEAPLVVSYQSSAGPVLTQELLAKVEALRVPKDKNPRGVEISRLALLKTD
jgi:intracellular multiplication protein IcmL